MQEAIANDLERQGWSVQDGFFPAALVAALYDDLAVLESMGTLKSAATGRGGGRDIRDSIRTDRTLWLTDANPAQKEFLDIMDCLRLFLNRRLMLGLQDYEAHYAFYTPGGFYKKHHDSFAGQRNRMVSTVLYLTPDWREEHGGHLALYDPADENREIVRIIPVSGRFVAFMSEEIPHEVFSPTRNRASVAGWFRVDG